MQFPISNYHINTLHPSPLGYLGGYELINEFTLRGTTKVKL